MLGVAGGGDLMTGLSQIEFQQLLNSGFVFDQQNIGSHGDSSLGRVNTNFASALLR